MKDIQKEVCDRFKSKIFDELADKVVRESSHESLMEVTRNIWDEIIGKVVHKVGDAV